MSTDYSALLARDGGQPVITGRFQRYNSLGVEEKEAAVSVLDSGILSDFMGCAGDKFLGGHHVLSLESDAANFFGVKHAISVNSWTSGLIASVGAIGVQPGDEIIVSPWTMVASATAILHWNCIPVFVDIDPITYNISPDNIRKYITSKTKAIIAIDIFGLPCDVHSIKDIANEFNLKLITDSAQMPDRITPSGTPFVPDIGGISLNYHKHIHCGEGGILLTDSDDYATRLRLIRNHGEAVIQSNKPHELSNIIGYNFRLCELEAAIAVQQLKKLPDILVNKRSIATRIVSELQGLKGLTMPADDQFHNHSFYILALNLDLSLLSHDRAWICDSLRQEGLECIIEGYQAIHLNPIFQYKIAYGTEGFPWSGLNVSTSNIDYSEGICPVAEYYHKYSFIGIPICAFDFSEREISLLVSAFKKVWQFL